MAIITNTRTTTLANLMSDASALVVCRDVLDICTMGTDVSFDALNPLGYVGDALPANAAQLPNLICMDAYISAAGTGGTDGTFPFNVNVNPGGAGAAGNFTVSGGKIVDAVITANGAGYTGNVSLQVTASAGLTGASVLPQMVDVMNVAKNVQPALPVPTGGRTRRVGLTPNTFASRPTFNGKGWNFVNGTTTGLQIAKGGVAPGRVFEPYFEGFLDYVEVVTVKANGVPVQGRSPFSAGASSGGFVIGNGAVPLALENSQPLGAAMSDGIIYTIAKRTRFNIPAGTSTVKGWVAFGGQMTETSEAAGRTTANFSQAGANSSHIGSASGAANTAWHGDVYHYYREYIGISGRSDSDCADLVRRINERATSRYA